MNLKSYISEIPDFPKPGILFYDISTLLANPDAWNVALSRLTKLIHDLQPEILVGIESRGFLIGAPLASRLGLGFAMVRKKGKLPGKTVQYEYKLEYGSDTIEIQSNAIKKEQKVVILDDLLATGGTLGASVNLINKVGGVVTGAACLIELTFLNGRQKIKDIPLRSLMKYDY